MNRKMLFLLTLLIVSILTEFAFSDVPGLINYQGKLADSTGTAIDTTISVTFNIYRQLSGGPSIWTETHSSVEVREGVFNVLLGSISPVPDTLFKIHDLWLGTTFGSDAEASPRKQISSVPYSMNASNIRDTYNGSKDLMPNSNLKFFVYPRYSDSKVTLYLHGEGFAGAILAHTHTGTNAHSHTFSGTSGTESADHSHTFSSTTNPTNIDHQHTGHTSYYDVNLSHNHSASTSGTDGQHQHLFDFKGLTAADNTYLSYANLTTAPGPHTATALESVTPFNSQHSHAITVGASLSVVSHNHTFTSDAAGVTHTHSYSGTTSGRSVGHTHTITGTTSSDGSGLAIFGVAPGMMPTSVRVYIDGTPAAGPWSGQFSSGAIDLSSYIPDTQEHSIEIKEEGGTGGQIIYTLFVE